MFRALGGSKELKLPTVNITTKQVVAELIRLIPLRRKDVYYIASESSGDLTFYSPRTNLYAASGKRRRKATTGK